jgi:fructose 1,6-bisphosphatase
LSGHVEITARERQLLDALVEARKMGHSSPLRLAASETKMEYNSARNMLFRLRNRYDKARTFVEEYAKYRRKMGGRRYI